MNSDIRLGVGFWQHPKVRRLEKALGMRGIRSLQILWCWCAQNRPSGLLYGLDADDIEFAADWRGKKGAFFACCLGGGWMDETPDGYQLHEWSEHNAWQADGEMRKERARAAAAARWAAKTGTPADATAAPAMPASCSGNAHAYAHAYAPASAEHMPASCASNAHAYAPLLSLKEEEKREELRTPRNPPQGGGTGGEAPLPTLAGVKEEAGVTAAPVAASSNAPASPAGPDANPDAPAPAAPPGSALPAASAEEEEHLASFREASGFDLFWEAYPKKTGKKAAQAAWKRARDKPKTSALLRALAQQKTQEQWQREGGRFIPNPATWLNQGRWADAPPDAPACVAPARPGGQATVDFDGNPRPRAKSQWQKAQQDAEDMASMTLRIGNMREKKEQEHGISEGHLVGAWPDGNGVRARALTGAA